MRSPGSAQLVLDEVGTMVNCSVKAEGKKEPCYEDPQGSATAAESQQPGDPARPTQNGADLQAPAQVPSTLLGPLGQCPQPASAAPVCVCLSPRRMGQAPTRGSWVSVPSLPLQRLCVCAYPPSGWARHPPA